MLAQTVPKILLLFFGYIFILTDGSYLILFLNSEREIGILKLDLVYGNQWDLLLITELLGLLFLNLFEVISVMILNQNVLH